MFFIFPILEPPLPGLPPVSPKSIAFSYKHLESLGTIHGAEHDSIGTAKVKVESSVWESWESWYG